jgi:uncharacterized OB-fold protein
MSEPVPYEEGYFDLDPPRLIGSRCAACGEHFYPQRATCARCLSEDTAVVRLGARGTLYAWTYLRLPGFGAHRSAADGYAAGQVNLPEGPRVQAVLEGGPGDFRIGMAMELTLAPVGEDKQGRTILMYRFRPAAA